MKGSEKMNVAILGYGVVGSGVAKVLKENAGIITEKTGHELKVVKILDIRDFPLSEYRSIMTKNFEDIANDDTIETAGSRIRQAITSWINPSNALIKKTDRERYLVLFEHRYLQGFIDSKFDVVENVRKIAEELKFPLNLSIGIGTGGSLKENEARSRHALDLALGRGGGQVCLKDDNQFKFFGGKTGESPSKGSRPVIIS